MWDTTNLFKALSQEWEHESRTSAARAAWRRWAATEPALWAFAGPGEAVAYCRRSGPDAAAVLSAVAARAGTEPLAARAVLQAVLPGLAGVSRRAWRGGRGTWLWESVEELDQLVVATAYGLIRALPAGTKTPWAARRVVDGTWQRLRTAMAGQARWLERRASADVAAMAEPAWAQERRHRPGEELAAVLSDALARELLDPLDAWLVYRTRVEDCTLARLGPEVGQGRKALGRRRERAEGVLVGARGAG
ncbi:MAG: hypothetical protein AB1673_15305 [Actinomycetota bacterium]